MSKIDFVVNSSGGRLIASEPWAISGINYLNVCICNPKCDYSDLRKQCQGMNIALYVRNKKGDIVPVTEEMVRKSRKKK